MNHKIRIIKHGDRKEPELDRLEQPNHHTTQEITTTLKLWVSEFKARRRTDEENTLHTNKLISGTASHT